MLVDAALAAVEEGHPLFEDIDVPRLQQVLLHAPDDPTRAVAVLAQVVGPADLRPLAHRRAVPVLVSECLQEALAGVAGPEGGHAHTVLEDVPVASVEAPGPLGRVGELVLEPDVGGEVEGSAGRLDPERLADALPLAAEPL